jgi:predicted RNA-binding protein with PUA-like domain
MLRTNAGRRSGVFIIPTALPGIVGIADCACRLSDHTALDPGANITTPRHSDNPRWFGRCKYDVNSAAITPDELKTHPVGAMMLLRRGNRLSVMPVSESQ